MARSALSTHYWSGGWPRLYVRMSPVPSGAQTARTAIIPVSKETEKTRALCSWQRAISAGSSLDLRAHLDATLSL